MENISQKDLSYIDKFKLKAAEFMQAVDKLNMLGSDTSLSPELKAEYNELSSAANVIKGTIQKITSTVDSVVNFFSTTFNFDGATQTQQYINNPMPGLGVLPLIPIAAIVGALAVMSKFISDVYLFERKVTETKRLESEGYTPVQAYDIVAKTVKAPLIGNLTSMTKPVLIIGGLLLGFWAYTKLR